MKQTLIFVFVVVAILNSPLISAADEMIVNTEEDTDPLYYVEEEPKKIVKRAFWDQETKVVGIGIGFGMGHLMAGEYKNRGWIYTAAEIATLAAFGYGVNSYFGDTSIESFGKAVGSFATLNEAVPSSSANNVSSLLMVSGFVGFLAVKLIEGFEVWHKPKVVVLERH